jgi:DHA2 family multidrug resistance protein
MSDTGAKSKSSPGRKVNPWLVALAVIVPTFMEILDTTIANVALRYIAGGLSAAETDAEWVITSYLAANAIILPISGWLMAHLGRTNYFLISIVLFTVASALCGFATSLGEIILFRVIQGLAGGGLQPSSQGVLLDTFPPEKQGSAMTLFGVAALIGPIVGPTLGGYLCDNWNWRWIFLVNVPVGVLAFAASYYLVEDPPYLKEQREKLKKGPLNFDFIGLGFLALAMASWEVVLSKGQEWDWFGDPNWRIQALSICFVLGIIFFIWRELKTSHPIVDLSIFKDSNYSMCCVVLFCTFGVLYAASISLPAMLQILLGYDAYHAGLILSPGGFSTIAVMIIANIMMSKQFDVRWLIGTGLIVIAVANYWMSHMNILIGPWQFVWPRMILTAGLGFIFAPINVAAFRYVPQHLRGVAVGFANLLRNEGGSVGTSVSQTLEQRREQFHLSRLGEHLNELSPLTQSALQQVQSNFMQLTGDPVASHSMAIRVLANLRQQQAATLSYFDLFWVTAVLPLLLLGLIFFMKKSVADKGVPAGAE